MAMAKAKRKTTLVARVVRKQPLPEQLRQTFERATTDLVALAKRAKREFDHLDAATKRKVITGVSGVAALLALRARHRRKRAKANR